MVVVADAVRESTVVVGTGPATLLGATAQARAFAEAAEFSAPPVTGVPYRIVAVDGAALAADEHEQGVGTYTAGVFTRTAPSWHRKGGVVGVGACDFSAGTKHLYVATSVGDVVFVGDTGLVGNEKLANKGAANGYAGLDAAGDIDPSTIPLVGLYLLTGRFGSGRDGNITISGVYTMTRSMQWDTVTFSAGGFIVTQGFKVYARRVTGSTTSPFLFRFPTAAQNTARAGGAGGAGGAAGTAGSGSNGVEVGGSGGGSLAGAGTFNNGGNASAPTTQALGTGGDGGRGGTGSTGSSGAAGTSGIGATTTLGPGQPTSWGVEAPDDSWLRGASLVVGGAGGRGGGAGGGNGSTAGAGGGGGGAGGPVVDVAIGLLELAGFSSSLNLVDATGAPGGNGGNGSVVGAGNGGGGGGGGGGTARLTLGSYTGGSLADAVVADGGRGGDGGSGTTGGQSGANGGYGGEPGRATLFLLSTGSVVGVDGTRLAAAPPSPSVGVTGGIGSAGGTCRLSLP